MSMSLLVFSFSAVEKPSLVVMDLNLLGEENIKKKERFEGLQATKKILKLDPEAVIWGYTA